MVTQPSRIIERTAYVPPAFAVERVELVFDLDPAHTLVSGRLHLLRQHAGPLVLNGEALELRAIRVDDHALSAQEYALQDETLVVAQVPDRCVLDIEVALKPQENTSLSGLYVSRENFFTQCEAEGFRRIMYFPDRPDVMSKYTVLMRADPARYPILLSNGNLIEEGTLDDGRHYARWEDPFPKPSYLFALVAGHFAHVQERIVSRSGQEKLLQIYVEPRDLDKVGHAMESLKKSIRWDEERFGLELDLDRFMIVAVSDFNMGAMENKGLNIFNTKYVLANPQTATDEDFQAVEAVVGHEYFHNWTGNRITCRDWFQLTLKEGLTVFRDQEFSADMAAGTLEGEENQTARAARRIADVRNLRASQFPEDAGPMAHPIRPDSYREINNFYTPTVYEKGAEVIRMLMTLLGRDGFREGMDEYFRRHDGQAVTCDDFVSAMESVYVRQRPGASLDTFRRWYAQVGTPRVRVDGRYDEAQQRYSLTLTQSVPDGRSAPLHIPFAMGLVGPDGADLPLQLQSESEPQGYTRVLDLMHITQTFHFVNVKARPVPSLLRDFSAPIHVDFDFSNAELALLCAHDSDPYHRWEAGQRLATRELKRLTECVRSGQALALNPALVDAFRTVLEHSNLDPALKELTLRLPDEVSLGLEFAQIDPQAIHTAWVFVSRGLGEALEAQWLDAYERNQTPGPYNSDPQTCGKRALKNLALHYLMELGKHDALAWQQFEEAANMTDRFQALLALRLASPDLQQRGLQRFYEMHADIDLCVDKWLRAQATTRATEGPTLEAVQRLMLHPAFSLRNPNKVYALLLGYFMLNPAQFHRPDGQGYAFWEAQVLAVDAINPQVAARLTRQLDRWRSLAQPMRDQARAALERLSAQPLSNDIAEIIGRALEKV